MAGAVRPPAHGPGTAGAAHCLAHPLVRRVRWQRQLRGTQNFEPHALNLGVRDTAHEFVVVCQSRPHLTRLPYDGALAPARRAGQFRPFSDLQQHRRGVGLEAGDLLGVADLT